MHSSASAASRLENRDEIVFVRLREFVDERFGPFRDRDLMIDFFLKSEFVEEGGNHAPFFGLRSGGGGSSGSW